MSLYLIKLGKVISVIKHDGLWRASQRIWRAIIVSLHPVRSGDILFISSGVGDSALYRTWHVAEELQFSGFACSVTVQNNPFLIKYVSRFSVFVFHRTLYTKRLQNMITEIKKQGKEIIFETDDLVFDADFKKTNSYQNLNVLEKKQYQNGVGGEILQDEYVRVATTTTKFLADKLREEGKMVIIVPNKLSVQDVTDAELALQNIKKDPAKIRLGYFSGTISHNKDFATITDALMRIMEKYAHVELFLVGPLDVENVIVQKFTERIVQLPYVKRAKHFANIAQCDINLAPLEPVNPFCEAKSELKFFEAGIVKVPTVAVSNQTFREAIQNGVDGYVARGTEEWVAKISHLIEDEKLRRNMGERAYQTVVARYNTRNAHNREYVQYLFKKVHHIQNIVDCHSTLAIVSTAVIIVNWNGKVHLQKCLDSLQEQTDQNYSIIFVDNGSRDGSADFVMQNYQNITVILLKENTGFAYANNIAIQYAFFYPNICNIITLNNDTKSDEMYIAKMHTALRAHFGEKIGAIQPKLYNFFQKKIIDSAGILTCFELSAHNRGRNREDMEQFNKEEFVFGPSASAALYTREMLMATSLSPGEYFDNLYFAYYEDVDLAWRLHLAGYKTLFVPSAIVYHVHSATGHNYSPFKSFHIHRNHYFNIIKNASFLRFIGVMLFMPIRYFMLLSSVVIKKGPAAAVTRQKGVGDGLVKNVLHVWWDVLVYMPEMCTKRHIVQKKRCISTREVKDIFRKNHISIMDVIYKQYK